MSGLTVEQHTTLAEVAGEWDELAKNEDASPLMRPPWVETWWRAFGSGEPLVLAARRNGALRGVVPLERRNRVLRGMTNDHAVELAFLASDEEAGAALGRRLFELLGDRATLALVDPARPGVAGLRSAAGAGGHRIGVRVFRRAPYIALHASFGEYERRLPGHLRTDLARRLRRLEERGTVEFEVGLAEPHRVSDLLEEGFALEAGGWKGAEGTAVASREETLRFYRDAASWAASEGLLHLAFLRLDGQAIAFEYAIRDTRNHYRLKIGVDDSFPKFAPGKLLLRAVIQDAFDHGLERFELLGDADPYKLEWSSGLRDLVSIEAFGRAARGRGAHVVDGITRRVARRALAIARRR